MPIPVQRLTSTPPVGNPAAYVSVDTYDPNSPDLNGLNISDVGLQLHLARYRHSQRGISAAFQSATKMDPSTRRESLLLGRRLNPPLAAGEIAIDPVIGASLFMRDPAQGR